MCAAQDKQAARNARKIAGSDDEEDARPDLDDSEADPYGRMGIRELRKMANARKITMTGGADEDDIRDQLRAHDLAAGA